MTVAMAGAFALSAGPASATHGTAQHSPNMQLVANYSEGGAYRQGSDLAFWGNTLVAGTLHATTGGFRLLDISNPRSPQKISHFVCPSSQSDVSIWRDLVFISVDTMRAAGPDVNNGEPRRAEDCGAPSGSPNQIASGAGWEGVRIVSIANRQQPAQIAAVRTDCGSHTHTIVPDEGRNRILIYVLSYPLGNQPPNCNAASHRKVSVIEVPLDAPQNAKVSGTFDVSPSTGCHDVTVNLVRKIAGAACISESQMWDISDPAKPRVIAHIPEPRINIHHSSFFSWDGNTMVLGDELGGAAASPGCIAPGNPAFVTGGLWFYDVKDPTRPQLRGSYKIPQSIAALICTAHLFNAVPLRSEKDILVSSWYTGATTVLDFTDPANARQIAYYIPNEQTQPDQRTTEAVAWSSYWYNGHVYSNNYEEQTPRSRGVDVFSVDHPDLRDDIRLPRMNPQVQEALPPAGNTPGAGDVIGAPRRCTSRRRFPIRIRAPRGDRIRSVVVFVNGRRMRVHRPRGKRRTRTVVNLRGLPRGRVRVDITVRTRSGKRISTTRRYRTCTPRRRGSRRG